MFQFFAKGEGLARTGGRGAQAVAGHPHGLEIAGGLPHGLGQFDITDHRSVAQMIADLARNGYQAVIKDWEDPTLTHA